MPSSQINWKSILLTYQLIAKKIFSETTGQRKEIIHQLLTKHIEQIKQAQSYSQDQEKTVINLKNELMLEKKQISQLESSTDDRNTYEMLLSDLIGVLDQNASKSLGGESVSYVMMQLSMLNDSSSNTNPLPFIENQNNFSNPISVALFPNDYRIEAIESLLLIELDRYLRSQSPVHQALFLQHIQNPHLTIDNFLQEIFKFQTYSFERAALLFCCMHPTHWTDPIVEPYYTLIRDDKFQDNKSNKNLFEEFSNTVWGTLKNRLNRMVSSYLKSTSRNLPNITSEQRGSLGFFNTDEITQRLHHDSETLEIQIAYLANRYKEQNELVKTIYPLNDLFGYRSKYKEIKLSDWNNIKQEFEVKNLSFATLLAFVHLLQHNCALDELPQRLPIYLDVFIAYQLLMNQQNLHRILTQLFDSPQPQNQNPTISLQY